MKIRSTLIVLSACLVAASAPVGAQKPSGETRLVGVSLYDSGLKLIKMFGSPIEIQAVTLGGGGGGMGGGGGAGVPGGRGGGAAAGGGGGAAAEAQLWMDPFGPEALLQLGEEEGRGRNRSGGQMGPPSGMNIPRGPGQVGGGPGGAPYGPGAAPGGFGAPGGAGGAPRGMGSATSTESATFTRWVYKRPTSRYAFILDKFNRVVQIEVIGLNDPKCRTKRGIGLGATFGQIMSKYSRPDGYDISGDNMVIRFLVRDKVAFRLSRLEPNKPHRVTGVVVAAGKQ